MKPVIAVPYFPGSNGDTDVISRIKEYGMTPLPVYFHIGDERRLKNNSRILAEEADGAVLTGGFPYEDRLGYGIVPANIKPFADALRKLVDSGKPVIAFCSGNQIAHAMGLAFPPGSSCGVDMLENICDKGGRIVYHGFLNKEIHTRLECDPRRTAFTRSFKMRESVPDIIAHGGGRFWTSKKTLEYLLSNGMIVNRYCDQAGNIIDDFPVNPNGSMLNIESVTNRRGNLKIGMCHNERKLNALAGNRANLVFASIREYIEDNCPDLSGYAKPQDIPLKFKDFSYLSQGIDPERTVDIYIKMLTDDNERMTAQLFLERDANFDRRRLIRLELADGHIGREDVKRILVEIAKMDLFDGIMLKKDLPSVAAPGMQVFTYEVTGKDGERLMRDFIGHSAVIDGFSVMHKEIPLPNPGGYIIREKFWRNAYLREAIRNVHAGKVWFFADEQTKQTMLKSLLN